MKGKHFLENYICIHTHVCNFYCIKIKNGLQNYFTINVLPCDPVYNMKLCRFPKGLFGHS